MLTILKSQGKVKTDLIIWRPKKSTNLSITAVRGYFCVFKDNEFSLVAKTFLKIRGHGKNTRENLKRPKSKNARQCLDPPKLRNLAGISIRLILRRRVKLGSRITLRVTVLKRK